MLQRNLYPSGRSFRDIRERTAGSSGPCVFISYRSSDRRIALELAAAFDAAGLDYYIDVADAGLQAASASGDSEAVVKAIEEGIRRSTHLIGIVTEATKESWWVPFEIGSSRAAATAAGVEPTERTAYLVDRSVTVLPDYMKVSALLGLPADLSAWISKVVPFGAWWDSQRARSAGAAPTPSALPAARSPLRFYRR